MLREYVRNVAYKRGHPNKHIGIRRNKHGRAHAGQVWKAWETLYCISNCTNLLRSLNGGLLSSLKALYSLINTDRWTVFISSSTVIPYFWSWAVFQASPFITIITFFLSNDESIPASGWTSSILNWIMEITSRAKSTSSV